MDFYNGAPQDLQVPGYLKGDERVELVNLTPEGKLGFDLPGIKLQVESEIKGREGVRLLETPLDTLCLLSDEGWFYLVWRGGVQGLRSVAKSDVKRLITSYGKV